MPNTLHSEQILSVPGRTLSAPSLFAAFPDELQKPLLARATLRSFSPKQIIQYSGDAAAGFWVIKSGQVKIGRYGGGGRFQLLALLGEGDSYGELAVISGQGKIVDAVAMGICELYWVGQNELDEAIVSHPQLARELIRILSVQLQEALDSLILQRRMSASQLLARSLLALSRGASSAKMANVSQDDLAELIGASRMTVSSTLRKMEKQGLVKRHYRQIEILDMDALAQY